MNTYDEIAYPGYPFRQAHPDRMGVVARLLGMQPAPAHRCRVLELGCGDGGNLIPMAHTLPESEFTGIDLAGAPIARGRRLAADLGLRNLRLFAMDVCDVDRAFGEFDYIIAYGLYSWVPAPVRRRILEIARDLLAPEGVAYVNYNAYPGGHVRRMIREMLLFHIRGIDAAGERIARAQAFLKSLADSPALTDEYGALVKAEAARLLGREGAFLYHDELSEIFEPVSFHEFAAAAAACGLQYLAEATLSDAHTASGPLAAWLEQFPDPLVREQHLDFMRYRSFRHTLLCRREVALAPELQLDAVAGLWAASNASVRKIDGEMEFRSARATLRTAHPTACAVLTSLAERWPRAIPVSELTAHGDSESRRTVCAILLRAFAGEVLELYGTPPVVAACAGDRPEASALARLQARSEDKVSTPLHTYIALRDETARRLILLLDGTRDRAALLEALGPQARADDLERSLAALVRLGLLV
ncbi:MAG TPA: class I SAM-dependent methyltransferase [Bryobacteraceae bacterium]|nr:class I SAM-dependent methyltransferase [Bryobacteraceae bacterium]